MRRFVSCSVLALVLITLAGAVQAWTPGLNSAAQRVAQGVATPHQEMLVFFANREVNLAAVRGELSIDQYNAVQKRFHALNRQFSRQAVENAGFRPDFGARSFNPGTDTDVNVLATGNRRIQVDDIRQIEANYQRIARDHFSSQGVQTPVDRFDTDTDFMPHPDHTDQFDQIVQHINQRGGTAYATPGSVRAQIALGQDGPARLNPINIDDAMDYSAEMRRLSQAKKRSADAWLREAQAVQHINPDRASLFRARAQLAESQSAKYISRQFSLNNHVRLQHELPSVGLGDSGLDKALSRLGSLDRGMATALDAAAVRAMNQHGLQRASDQLVDTFGTLARLNPGQGEQFTRAIAQEISRMSPSKAGEAISRLERSVGGRFAQGVAQETRTLRSASRADPAPEPSSGWGGKAVRIMAIGTTGYFMGKEGVYHALDQTEADDTTFDFFMRVYQNAAWYGTGVGYAYEEAEKAEIARFMREVERGNDPSLTRHVTVTLLKVPYLMARDAVTGILYLPDAVVEAITGAKEAEAREQASKAFLAEVQRLVRHREQIDEAFAHAEEMGVRPEDAEGFLNCLCRGCGGSLGGFFCVGEGCNHSIGTGPCVCKGPLSTWNTPIPRGMEESLHCFNAVTRKHHYEAQAIFNRWRERIASENYQSAEAQVKEVIGLIEAGDFEEAAWRYQSIAPLVEGYVGSFAIDGGAMYTQLDRHLEGRISVGLAMQARALMADVSQRNPTGQAVEKIHRAREINAHYPQDVIDRLERWHEGWQTFLDDTLPRVDELIEAGRFDEAQQHLVGVRESMNRDLPPRANDPSLKEAFERLYARQAERNEAEKHWERARAHQARQAYQEALEAYKAGLSIWPDDAVQARVARLESYLALQDVEEALGRSERPNAEGGQQSPEQPRVTTVNIGSDPTVATLTPPREVALPAQRGSMDGQQRERVHALQVERHGHLIVDVQADGDLQLAAQLRDFQGGSVLNQDYTGRKANRRVEQADLAPGVYEVRVYRHTGEGAYEIRPRLQVASTPNDQEPNNAAEEARLIPVDGVSTGLMGYRTSQGRDTEDWFRIMMPVHGRLVLDIQAEDTLQLAAQLRDEVGSGVLHQDYTGRSSHRTVERADLAPGTYYLRLYRHTGQGGYRVLPRVEAVTFAADSAPNERAEQAQAIPLGEVSTGLLGYRDADGRDTEDWYQVTLREHGRLVVNIEAEESLRLAAQLRDEAGSGVLHQDYTGRAALRQLERADLAPGTYYLRIYRHEGQGGYTVTPRLESVVAAGEPARNNSAEQARVIEPGSEVTSLLGYRDASGHDTEDWFRFTTRTPGRLVVNIHADAGLRLAAQLRDASASRTLVQDYTGRASSRRLEREDLEPATYYVRIYRHEGQGSYRLSTRIH